MTNAVLISAQDTVVTVIEPISKGGTVTYRLENEKISLTASTDVPRYHKLALRPVKRGEIVVKYGEHIGVATADISVGEHVHTQNMDSCIEEGGTPE